MRKLILISALLLASASAQAGQSRGLVLADADTPAATATDTPAATATDTVSQPLPPVAKTDATRPQTSEPSAPAPHTSRPHSQARRYESDEAKARRIAARFGISW